MSCRLQPSKYFWWMTCSNSACILLLKSNHFPSCPLKQYERKYWCNKPKSSHLQWAGWPLQWNYCRFTLCINIIKVIGKFTRDLLIDCDSLFKEFIDDSVWGESHHFNALISYLHILVSFILEFDRVINNEWNLYPQVSPISTWAYSSPCI